MAGFYTNFGASRRSGSLSTARRVFRRRDACRYPAVTIAVSKKPGENAVDVAAAVIDRLRALGAHVSSFGVREPDLEDVFLQLVDEEKGGEE